MDSEDDNYELTDSELEYDEDERELIEDLRKERKERNEQDGNEEVLLFSDSDEDDAANNDDVGELMRDSDIEGAEDDDGDLPDTMNWGNKKSAYYNTDFVDPDYSNYNAQEEEQALAEEEEAKKIQLRLAKQMQEADFHLDNVKLPESDSEDDTTKRQDGSIHVLADLTGLNERERLQLLQKDSPEFIGLTQEFQQYLAEVQELTAPVLNYVRNHNVPMVPALSFASLYQNVLLTYCSNVSFYLLLKAKRSSVKHHPVIKRIVQLKQVRQQLTPRYEEYIRPQLEALLERIQDGDAFTVLDVKQRKAKLQILNKYEKRNDLENKDNGTASVKNNEELDDDDDVDHETAEEDDQEDEESELSRRGITYQIAKNKGLTPHRKKELRNPRVKHRGKYRKAIIRRKGAVRAVRKETKRYGGEISGIKATVTKSIKFKT
ncbi:something about silencing protein 10 [Scaptodrosophila lebanonensis]|uniref:Something about silencing protein 10 n=1 Tax=Drosophila lebanonensis TaxID=7225 RepID=A0A6J2TQ32_DROLE|nr:something about silencing protein 10 [Scaptodrosophila lebanonensis]